MQAVRVTVTDALTEAERVQLVKLVAYIREHQFRGQANEFSVPLWDTLNAKLSVSTSVTIVRELV